MEARAGKRPPNRPHTMLFGVDWADSSTNDVGHVSPVSRAGRQTGIMPRQNPNLAPAPLPASPTKLAETTVSDITVQIRDPSN